MRWNGGIREQERVARFHGKENTVAESKLRAQRSPGRPGPAGRGSQAEAASWASTWHHYFTIGTAPPSPRITAGVARMMLQCSAMPTAARAGETGLSCHFPVLCWLPVALATIHSLASPPFQKGELRPATVATVTGTPLSGLAGRVLSPPPGGRGTRPRCRGNS